MAKIIISYRRSDSDVFAGRVHDRIVSRYGDQSVFIDVDNIPFGKDFRVHIQEELANADAIMVIVGPKWLGPARGGHYRIMDATDPVRIEVETALSRGVPTIPILVGNTSMPRPEQLPETFKDFPFLNAAPVDTSRDSHRDLNRVMATIDRILHLPLTNEDHRAAEPEAQSKAEIVQQTERDRLAREAEAKRIADEDEVRKRAEVEAQRRAEEERAKVERKVEEQRKRAEIERKAEEELQRANAEARRKAAEEADDRRLRQQSEHVPVEQAEREVHHLAPTARASSKCKKQEEESLQDLACALFTCLQSQKTK